MADDVDVVDDVIDDDVDDDVVVDVVFSDDVFFHHSKDLKLYSALLSWVCAGLRLGWHAKRTFR